MLFVELVINGQEAQGLSGSIGVNIILQLYWDTSLCEPSTAEEKLKYFRVTVLFWKQRHNDLGKCYVFSGITCTQA